MLNMFIENKIECEIKINLRFKFSYTFVPN